MTREEIIKGFNDLYFNKIAAETARRGVIGALHGGGIDMERLKEIHAETVADYYEQLLNAGTCKFSVQHS